MSLKNDLDLTDDFKSLRRLTALFGFLCSPLLTYVAQKINYTHPWYEIGPQHFLITLALLCSMISGVINLSSIFIRHKIRDYPLKRVIIGCLFSLLMIAYNLVTNPMLYTVPFIVISIVYIDAVFRSNRSVRPPKIKRIKFS